MRKERASSVEDGFFDMAMVHRVRTMNLVAAKNELSDFVMNHPVAREKNKRIALSMIQKAKNITQLQFGMTNLMLAYAGMASVK